jgi:hypothetical protein
MSDGERRTMKRRERDRRYQAGRRAEGRAWDQQPQNRGRVRERKLRYWHKPGGGYIRRRKRDLAAQRADVTARLLDLRQQLTDLHNEQGRRSEALSTISPGC